ncbi:MAG: phosphoribosyltransferase family protein [Sulfuricella sp.]|jgi:adenine phosphoribosyltransferase
MEEDKICSALAGKREWEARLLSALSDSTKFNKIVEALKELYDSYETEADQVACFEALGFPLGASVAHELKAGLVLVRKTGPDVLSPDFETEKFCDYDNKQKIFKVLKSAVPPGTRILIVDDLCEKGEQLKAAAAIFKRLGATVIGAVFIGCRRVDNGCGVSIRCLKDEDVVELLPYLQK